MDAPANSPVLYPLTGPVENIGRSTLFKLIKSGELRPVRIGRRVYLPRTELERFVNSKLSEQ